MTHHYAIALDVGGTFIKSAVLNELGDIVPNTVSIFPSKSKKSKQEIMENLFSIIKHNVNMVLDTNFKIIGVGFAFPGPFDYQNGISYIREVDKFDTLYNTNVREALLDQLNQNPFIRTKLSEKFQIIFDNDGNLFALGEKISRSIDTFKRAIYLTIGSGLGSAFMEDGILIAEKYNIPKSGWIYNQPFRDGIVDDYISKRGILQLAEELRITVKENEPKALADKALNHNEDALEVFRRFGRNLGEILNEYTNSFRPEAIILGGQISKSKDLFLPYVYEVLDNKNVIIEVVHHTSQSIFKGVANLLQQATKEASGTPLDKD